MKFKMKKSLLTRGIVENSLIILITVLILVGMSYNVSSNIISGEINKQLSIKLENTKEKIFLQKNMVQNNLLLLSNLSAVKNITNNPGKNLETSKLIKEALKSNEDILESIYIMNKGGFVVADSDGGRFYNSNFSRSAYFNESKKGEIFWSDTSESIFTGNTVQIVSCPIIEDNGEITGVIAATIKFKYISDMLGNIKIGQNGYAHLINRDGKYIFHPDNNLINTYVKDLGIEDLDNNLDKMINGDSDSFEYKYQGDVKLSMFMPVDKWCLSLNASKKEYLAPVNNMKNKMIIISFICLIVAIIFEAFSSFKMIYKIKRLMTVMSKVSEGNLQVKIDVKEAKSDGDELQQMGKSLNSMIESFNFIVNNIRNVARELSTSSQQLSSASKESSLSAEDITKNTNNITQAADNQVTQITFANKLANDMNYSLQRTAKTTRSMTDKASKVNAVAEEGQNVIEDTINQMNSIKENSKNTLSVISSLNTRSEEIGKINKIITEIAEQTNLLALNAAIEAARAGEEGKGFAVVADEIRKLAYQSSKSAKEIQQLIDIIQIEINNINTLIHEGNTNVNTGMASVFNSKNAFGEIEQNIKDIVMNIQEVTLTVEENEDSSNKVSKAVDDMVEIIEQYSAKAQEVLAATEQQTSVSEEIESSSDQLSNMANKLLDTIYKFKI